MGLRQECCRTLLMIQRRSSADNRLALQEQALAVVRTAASGSPFAAAPGHERLLPTLVQQQHLLPASQLTCNTSSGSNPFSPLAAPSSCRKRRMLSLRPSGACPCGWPLCCCARKKSRLRCKAALLSRCCCALVPLADRWVAADCRPGSAGAPACSALPMAASSRFTAAWMTCEAGCSKVRGLHAALAGGCRLHGLQGDVQRCQQACHAPSLQHR